MSSWFNTKSAALEAWGSHRGVLFLQRQGENKREYGTCPATRLKLLDHTTHTYHDCYPGDGALCDVVIDLDNNTEQVACKLAVCITQIMSLHWHRVGKKGSGSVCRMRIYSCSGDAKESYHVCVSVTDMCFASRGGVWDTIMACLGAWAESEGGVDELFDASSGVPAITVDFGVTRNGSLRALGSDKQEEGGGFVGRRKRLFKSCDAQLPLGVNYDPVWDCHEGSAKEGEVLLSMGFNRGARVESGEEPIKLLKLCQRAESLLESGKAALEAVMGAKVPKRPRAQKASGTVLVRNPVPCANKRPGQSPELPLQRVADEKQAGLLWVVAKQMCKVYAAEHGVSNVAPATKASVYVYDILCNTKSRGVLTPFASHQRAEVATSCKWCDKKGCGGRSVGEHKSRCVILSCNLSTQPVTFVSKCFSDTGSHSTTATRVYRLWPDAEAEHDFAWAQIRLRCNPEKRLKLV